MFTLIAGSGVDNINGCESLSCLLTNEILKGTGVPTRAATGVPGLGDWYLRGAGVDQAIVRRLTSNEVKAARSRIVIEHKLKSAVFQWSTAAGRVDLNDIGFHVQRDLGLIHPKQAFGELFQ